MKRLILLAFLLLGCRGETYRPWVMWASPIDSGCWRMVYAFANFKDCAEHSGQRLKMRREANQEEWLYECFPRDIEPKPTCR